MVVRVISGSDWVEKGIRQKVDAKELVTDKDITDLKKEVVKREREVSIPKFYYIPVVILFILSNLIVFGIVTCVAYHDIANLGVENYSRFLTQSVIMSLIGGTVTQTGLAFYLIGKIYSKSVDNIGKN